MLSLQVSHRHGLDSSIAHCLDTADTEKQKRRVLSRISPKTRPNATKVICACFLGTATVELIRCYVITMPPVPPKSIEEILQVLE